MILFWMKHNSTMLVITQGSFLRVIGERPIHRINQAAGCRQFSSHHQANSITLWTLVNDPVFTCDNCSVALHVALQCNSILPKNNWTEFTTQDACQASLCIHGHWGQKKNSQSKRIQTFHGTDKAKTHRVTLKCTVNMLNLAPMLGLNRETLGEDVQCMVLWQGNYYHNQQRLCYGEGK